RRGARGDARGAGARPRPRPRRPPLSGDAGSDGEAARDAEEIRARVLPLYDSWQDASVARFGGGLINRTYLLERAGARAVLQRVSPIFPPAIHDNIQAVTARLAEAGMVTPR